MDTNNQPTPPPARMAVVSPKQVDISFWNQRRTRTESAIQILSARLAQYGFDPTRPIKVHLDPGRPDHYLAFAGGTRLQAAKRADLPEVHIAIYEGLTEQEIVQMSVKDNEDDESHSVVCIVDRWRICKDFADYGWDPETIAKTLRLNRATVYHYLSYANFPPYILDPFSEMVWLKDSHMAEIAKILNFRNLAGFVRFEVIVFEIIEQVLEKAGREGPTADQFRKKIETYNAFLDKANDRYIQIGGNSDVQTDGNQDASIPGTRWQLEFVGRLAERKARSVAEVDQVYTRLTREMEQEAQRAAAQSQQVIIEQQRLAAEAAEAQRRLDLEAQRGEMHQAILANLVQGDARELLTEAPVGARLAFFDPPYGEDNWDYKNHRRYATARHAPMANDSGEAALALLAAILPVVYEKLLDDSILLMWSGDELFPKFRQAVEDAGFTYRSTVIWFKPGHGAGDLTGDFAPQHEYLIYAVKGNPKLNPPRLPSVLEGGRFLSGDHPTKKPVDLIEKLIVFATQAGDLVLDPFAGIGSVPITAFQLGRQFWGCELDQHYHRTALDLLYTEADAYIEHLLREGEMVPDDPESA